MTEREREIIELLKKNPMISQKDLSEKLGITRSSVAVHITNLIKKGYIVGKGYIIREEPYISVIGGSNMDIQGKPSLKLNLNDSNPGVVSTYPGGVGRNISENLCRLGLNTKLLTAVGNDVYGNKIMDECRVIGIDINNVLRVKEENTSTYLYVLDEKGDMLTAISHMDITRNIDKKYLNSQINILNNSEVCIIDTNISEEAISYIVENVQVPIFVDTVSTNKALKIKNVLGKFHTIKPNKIEAEILSGIEIVDYSSLKKAGDFFLAKGVKNIFISLGKEGIYYSDGINEGRMYAKDINVINTTGAGDSFMAGLAYSYTNSLNIEEAVCFSMSSAICTLGHEMTINPEISEELVMKTKESINFLINYTYEL